MNAQINVRFLSQEDQIKAGCFNFPMIVDIVEKTLQAYEAGRILFPEKIIQQFREMPQDRINCMPSTLIDEGICGVKWVSVFNDNPVKYHKQSICGIMVLSEIVTGFPVYFMDATLCSSMRVAGIGALGAKYFARPDSSLIGFMGAGEQAKTHLLGIKAMIPTLKECRVCGMNDEEEQLFASQVQEYVPDMCIVPAHQDLDFAMSEADILVTATPSTTPRITAKMVKPGAYISQIGPYEVEADAVRLCDKVMCDNWDAIRHRGSQPLTLLGENGEITDDSIIEISQVATGKKPRRETSEERVYFKHVGLSYLDLAIALHFARQAEAKGLGQELHLQETMLFSHPDLRHHCTL